MTRFRLATINVHSFNNPSDYENNIEELISILKPLDLDLIAVQEIQKNNHWSNFCKHLSLSFTHIGSGDGNYYGIGIASRYPIISPYDQQTSFASLGGKRFFFKCCLGGDHPFVKDRIFAVTHLDHLNENDRLTQIEEFSPVGHNVSILMGDMNALTRDDYSDDYYQKNLVQVREKSNWERPYFDLTRLITTRWGFQDAFKQINPQLKDQSVTTSRYGTRIDYIYWRPRDNDEWKLKDCFIVDTKKATDHNAVVAEFEQKS
ncbi:unnamed protein product [Rotaria sp. Silwood1]|nr:unnamed protein product [Rotaria sp. Silwood1]CAF1595368.1 unnamed protein product [Rotaria sp. Silwood1]CAF3696455.1 unnamed protein product [Rotaria sp. Silwood1]CAF5114111.1 unnamed protein product [Rotaria sp. Silwood1]